ncbi:MAG: dTMP kinase [Chloroflexota bacterium]|nr:dTMP kinase [Chloroflexota bacterium]MDE3192501.1 dTMP kinase [Chloroflexota bacterium]
MTRGLLLSFEGGEASGKSVQARRLVASLHDRGTDVLLVREPGGTPAGERIREILLHARDVALTPEAQALLFMAARAQLVRDVVRPALARGAVVVADRYFDSTLAYQGFAGGADLDGLRELTRFAVGPTVPDRTFLLDVPVDVVVERSRARAADRPWDRFEERERAFHERLRDGYLRLAAAEPRRFVVVPGDRDEAEIAREILREVDALLATPA